MLHRQRTQACQALRSYTWPGNVRELQNRLKRAVVLAEGATIATKDLELHSPASGAKKPTATSLKKAKEELERTMIQQCLAMNDGNISRSARSLGISRPTLYDLISKYRL